MKYRRLGRSGLNVSVLSYGAWVTFSNQLDLSGAKKILKYAFDQGVNFFDNAEAYAHGEAEAIMGKAIKIFPRQELVVSTKLFWGGAGPNDTGLSHKHLHEGIEASLKRLDLDYVDLVFCHRPDFNTPVEETVRAMDAMIRRGQALYWGTSEWPADRLFEAFKCALDLGCVPPTMEQPEYNLFNRRRVEVEFQSLYEKYGLGTTIWSPLSSGVLTGKYLNGIPEFSRLASNQRLVPENLEQRNDCVRALQPIAAELGVSLAQLAIAWCLFNPHVSTVILGAASVRQLEENLASLSLLDKLDQVQVDKISQACAACADV